LGEVIHGSGVEEWLVAEDLPAGVEDRLAGEEAFPHRAREGIRTGSRHVLISRLLVRQEVAADLLTALKRPPDETNPRCSSSRGWGPWDFDRQRPIQL
jgi:hypothetical protein